MAAVEDAVSGKCSEPRAVDSALSLNNSGRWLVSSIHSHLGQPVPQGISSLSLIIISSHQRELLLIRYFKFQLVKQIVWSDHEMILKYHRLWPKLKVCPAMYSSVITCSLSPRSTSPKCVRARRQQVGCNYPNRPAVQSSSQRGVGAECPRRRGGIARQGRGIGSQSGNIGSVHRAIDLHPVEIGLLC